MDKINYYDKWWFILFRPFCVPIERGCAKQELQTIQKKIKPFLEQGGIMILFPEGGRTFKAKNIRGQKSFLCGREIARFPCGIRKLFLNSNCRILPCWTEGGDKVILNRDSFDKTIFRFPNLLKKTKIIIGEQFLAKDIPKNNLVDYLEDKLIQTK